ncbi:hypothetical protein HMSSN139_11990 [Paenibacillus sp. HMSSN-139]|nr:hypothetical protein HMSSN139_11990 [Paenibacillus sp. HMSSN-139]
MTQKKKIIDIFAREFFVTNGGGELKLGPTSIYRYFLLKPTELYQEMFNIDRELVVILSPYETFQPRTLDAFDHVYKLYEKLRIDRICGLLVSQDNEVVRNLGNILKNDKEAQIIVPFSYNEIIKQYDAYFIRNRFKEHFYTRDLFAFRAPLKKDLYFFGRKDLVHNIVNRHKSNENSGLFGLRKTGKTSVIFGIERVLDEMDEVSVFIDCQSPAFHKRRWNKALHYIVYQIVRQNEIDYKLRNEEEYTEENAPIVFEEELAHLTKLFDNKPIMIIFDEIENMTFTVSASEHWSKELDFVYFWQTLRSIFKVTIYLRILLLGQILCVSKLRQY